MNGYIVNISKPKIGKNRRPQNSELFHSFSNRGSQCQVLEVDVSQSHVDGPVAQCFENVQK
jgi:hypothetical protein